MPPTQMPAVPQQYEAPYNEDDLYKWSGDEHGKDCPLHEKNIGQAKAAYRKAKEKDPRAKPPACANIEEECCPADLVINASNQPMIIGAQAQVPWDNAKIMPGDRRRGPFYIELMRRHQAPYLQRLRDVNKARRVELDKMRRLRTGDEPDEWVKESWKKLSPEDRRKMEERGLGEPATTRDISEE